MASKERIIITHTSKEEEVSMEMLEVEECQGKHYMQQKGYYSKYCEPRHACECFAKNDHDSCDCVTDKLAFQSLAAVLWHPDIANRACDKYDRHENSNQVMAPLLLNSAINQ